MSYKASAFMFGISWSFVTGLAVGLMVGWYGFDRKELAERHKELCGMVAEGKTIRQIATHYGVSAGSIIAWLTDTPERTEQYARARYRR